MLGRPPLLSIVTVTWNSGHLLEGTIHSVLEQTYPHIEYLIIDGASTDHTLTILKLAEMANRRLLGGKLLRIVSEPDEGLYDAMNKGQRTASGDFILFLNAGDRLFERTTIEKMLHQATTDTDVLFGEVMLVTELRTHLGTRSELSTQVLPENLTWESLRKGMVVSHQAFIARRAIAPEYMSGNLAADIDWVISILKRSRQNVHTGHIVAEFLVGGVSKQRHQQSLWDRYEVLKKHYGFWPNFRAHVQIVWRSFWDSLWMGRRY